MVMMMVVFVRVPGEIYVIMPVGIMMPVAHIPMVDVVVVVVDVGVDVHTICLDGVGFRFEPLASSCY